MTYFKLFSLQFGLCSAPHSILIPESFKILLLRFNFRKLEQLESKADAKSPQLFSVMLQPHSLEHTAGQSSLYMSYVSDHDQIPVYKLTGETTYLRLSNLQFGFFRALESRLTPAS